MGFHYILNPPRMALYNIVSYVYYFISVCGTGNEVCGAGETCKNNSCLARMCIYTKICIYG